MALHRPAVLARVYRADAKIGRFLWALILSGIAGGLYKGIQDNYLAEIIKISAFERGIVEFFRELPGLLVIFFLAWMYRFTENKIFKIGIVLMFAGLTGLCISAPQKVNVVVLMVLYSAGEHIIMPVRSSISLDLAKREKGGASLGITSALGHGGNIAGFLLVTGIFFLFSRWRPAVETLFQFKTVFASAAALSSGALLAGLALRDSGRKAGRRRFYFARKFSKYYLLEVFYGSRKQIFMTFAPYVLILNYKAPASVISMLLAISAVFSSVASPFIGKLIDRAGYKVIMVNDTIILVVVCFFYGFSHRLFPAHIAFYVVCVNYVLDAVISVASMASNVYVRDIADNQEEVTATISTGISVNHLISILIALLGGFIWDRAGIEVLFSCSAVLGLLNTLYAATIQSPKKLTKI
jgi:MFS family permease